MARCWPRRRATCAFGSGAREQSANFDLPVQLTGDALVGSGRELVVRAALVAEASDAGLDVLPADDVAVAVVRLRDRLQVALIDSEQDVNPNLGELEPWQWVRAALSPSGPSAAGSFELSSMLPTAVNRDAIESFDAAVVLRPDQLTQRGWETLTDFTEAGGLVWVFTPALDTEADWAQTMARLYELPWSFADATYSRFADDSETIIPIAVDATTPAPEQLQYLAADWREKLSWISVRSWLPTTTPEEDHWVLLDDDELEAQQGGPGVLLAERAVGDGALVFSAVPMDTRYTNLPMRQLFVPLMHDTLRGVLGNTSGQRPLVAGDQAGLAQSWRGVGEVDLLGGEQSAKLLVQSDDQGGVPPRASRAAGRVPRHGRRQPEIARGEQGRRRGDTIGGTGRLELLLDELGGWSYLSDRQQAGGVLAKTALGWDLTMLLLWVLLGLVLLETCLARWFSHATDHGKPTIIGRALGALQGKSLPGAEAGGGV